MDGLPLNTDDSPSILLEMIFRIKIRDVMDRGVKAASPQATMKEAQELMRQGTVTGIPIVEDKRLVGLLSMQNILAALEQGQMQRPVGEYMVKKVTVLEEDMPLSFAINYMDKYHYRYFPVLNTQKELVGIVSSRDIVNHLLVEMNKELMVLERLILQKEPPSSNVKKQKMTFVSHRFDFENAGKASTEIKKLLKKQEVDRRIVRRVAVASYELEINQVIHSEGGKMTFTIQEDSVTIEAIDTGPGIPEVEKALTEGFSTADDWIRSLGFGAGMGLPNIKRVCDEFSINSAPGTGTAIRCTIYTVPSQS